MNEMLVQHFLIALFVAFCVSVSLCFLFITRNKQTWLDLPNERSLHKVPVPRLGGIAIASGVACAVLLLLQGLQSFLTVYHGVAAAILLAIAVLDDRQGLHPLIRLLAQVVAAAVLVWGAHAYVSAQWLTGLWPVLGIVVLMWCINLYNFMDGMDGFAGAMGVVGFATLSILAVMQGQTEYAMFCAVIVAACIGFLCFNFPPARIFMGDSGSTLLGMFMGALSIHGWKSGIYPLWVPLLVFSPFWVDATVTLCKRLCKREKVWLPHRQHHYQRWVLAGYSHRQVLRVYVCLMLACSATAILQQHMQQSWMNIGLPLAWVVCYGLIILQSERKLRQNSSAAAVRSKG